MCTIPARRPIDPAFPFRKFSRDPPPANGNDRSLQGLPDFLRHPIGLISSRWSGRDGTRLAWTESGAGEPEHDRGNRYSRSAGDPEASLGTPRGSGLRQSSSRIGFREQSLRGWLLSARSPHRVGFSRPRSFQSRPSDSPPQESSGALFPPLLCAAGRFLSVVPPALRAQETTG